MTFEDNKAVAVMSYFANYAMELIEINKAQADRLEEVQQLLVQVIRELGPAALVHPNPLVRELALDIQERIP